MVPRSPSGIRFLLWLLLLFDVSSSCVFSNKAESTSVVDPLVGAFSRKWMKNLAALLPLAEDEGTNVISLRRRLAIGDFDEFNELFRNATIRLPDAYVEQKVALLKLKLNIRNLRCTNLEVADIRITYNKESLQRLTFQVDIVDLDMTCYLDYDYKYGFLSGSGSADAFTDNNDASAVLAFSSPNFDYIPPSGSSVERCNADINVSNLDFDGGIVAGILDIFDGLIGNVVEGEVEGVACDELGSLGSTFVEDMLGLAADFLKLYLVEPDHDPLSAERALVVPDNVLLLDYQDTDSVIGTLFDTALKEVDALLGTEVEDADGPTGTGRDLGFNVFLRSFLLDENRAYALNVDDVFPDGVILFQGHDMLTQTTIRLDTVKIFGLDTFTRFEPFLDIGRYTLRNELSWEFLLLEIDVTIEIEPSTKEDSVIVDTGATRLMEKVKIEFGVDKVDVVASLLLAIDQELLGDLQLGTLLNTEYILPCLLSTMFDVALSGLSVEVDNIRTPTLDGFVSRGIDILVSDSAEAAFMMYETLLLKAMPEFCEMSVRDFVNENIIKKWLADSGSVQCPNKLEVTTPFIDFRDLFLEPELALISGGSGEAPYGDLASTLMRLLQDQFGAIGEDGSPKINSVLIRQLTEAQSGVEGLLQFPSDLFRVLKDNITNVVWSSVAERIELKGFNTRFTNLDTVTAPLSVLQPSSHPHILTNQVNMGLVPGRSFIATVRLLMSLQGEDSPLSMRNVIDISVLVPSSVFMADFLATIDANRLLQFPIEDVLNYNCWLATIPALSLDETGNPVDPSADPSLAFANFLMILPSLSFNITCVSCTSPGVIVLPELLGILEETGIIDTLRFRLETFVKEILEGDWLEIQLNRFLAAAPKLCPHSPSYDNAVADYGTPGLPNMSRDAIETLVLAAILMSEVAIVVSAESHLLVPAEASDPLSGQSSLDIQPDINFLDWMDLSGTVGSWAEMVVEEARNYLGSSVEDAGTGRNELGMNVVLRNLLLGDDGVYIIAFSDIGIDIAGMEIALLEFRINGLDSLSQFDIFDPIGPQTLQNHFRWDSVRVEADVSIKRSDFRGVKQGGDEKITLSFGMSNVDVSLALLLALDLDSLADIELGSVLHTDQILPCFLSSLHQVNVPQMLVSVANIEDPVIEGFMSDSLRAIVSSSVETVFDTYRSDLIAAMPSIFDTTARGLLNGILQSYIGQNDNDICPTPSVPSGSEYIDFRDLLLTPSLSRELGGIGASQYGDVFQALYNIVNEQLLKTDAETGILSANSMLIGPLTRAQSNVTGTLVYPGDLLNTGTKLSVGGLDAKVELKAYNARIERLDTLGEPVALLNPVSNDRSTLNNTASFAVGSEPLRFGVRFLFALLGDDDLQIRNEVDISLDVKSITVVLGALLKILEERFLSFPLADVTNIYCWMATIPAPALDSTGIRAANIDPTAALTNLAVSVARLNLNITCVNCSSPEMEDLTLLLSSPEAVEDVTEVANRLLDYATQLLGGEFLQIPVDRMLNDAAQRCPHSPSYVANPTSAEYEAFEVSDRKESSIAFLIAIVVSIGCLGLAVAIILFVMRLITRRRHGAWIRSLSSERLLKIYKKQMKEQEEEAALNKNSQSMFRSKELPWYVRYFMPVVILGNIAFFLSGHLSLGATVNIVGEIAGEEFLVEQFFEFSMAQSTVDIWQAGGKELAVLILIFSGIWPYTKQLISLALWFLPPRIVSVSRRGSIFHWLDVLAKWSMVDVFVLVVSISAFRVTIESPDVAFLPEGFYSLNLMVVPLWGLYANMIAQLISQISSHFIIHYQRRIVKAATAEYERGQITDAECTDNDSLADSQNDHGVAPNNPEHVQDDSRDVLWKHAFARPHRGESDKLQVRRGVNAGVVVAAIAIVSLVIVGCIIPSYSLEVLGIIGVAVESGQGFEQAIKEYGVFSTVKLLLDQAKFLGSAKAYIGNLSLSILVIMTVLIVPIIQTLVLLRQWFASMRRKNRARSSILIEILQAWQYVEVYVLSVLVAAWQLGPISEFMINEYCDNLKGTFDTLVFYGILNAEDAQCFQVQAYIENATYVLIAGAVVLALLNAFVVKAVVQYFRDQNSSAVLEENPKWDESTQDTESEDAVLEAMEKIQPVPVLFTDNFRWFLRREDAYVSQRMLLGLDDSAKLGVEDSFPIEVEDVPSSHAGDTTLPAGNCEHGEAAGDVDSEASSFYAEKSGRANVAAGSWGPVLSDYEVGDLFEDDIKSEIDESSVDETSEI